MSTPYVRGYTALLMGFGFFLLIGAIMMHTLAERADDPWALLLVRNIETVMGAGCLLVAILRALESKLADAATTAISWLLLIWLPFGTAAFVWWFVSVRKREDRAFRAKATTEAFE